MPLDAAAASTLHSAGKALLGSDQRVVAPENYHLTIAFLGNVAADFVPAIARAVEKHVSGCSFTAHLGHIARFPSRRSTLVAAQVVESDPGFAPLVALRCKVINALESIDQAFDDKPFRPHVTIARRVRAAQLAGSTAIDIRTSVSRVCVYSSTTSPSGGQYRVLCQVPLD